MSYFNLNCELLERIEHMPRLQEINYFEAINEILEQEPKLHLPVGVQLIEMGFYWLRVHSGDKFLREYIEASLLHEIEVSFMEH